MIVTIHQPSYLPWVPFLEKGLRSDVYVMLDNVQFEKNSETNRNRIKTAQGATWLTVPVSRQSDTLIYEVQIRETQQGWRRKHRRTIEESYRKAPYFDVVAPPLFDLLDRNWESLLPLNLAVDKLFLEFGGFSGRVLSASEMEVPGTNWRKVLEICQALGADTYLSGLAGFDYMDLPAFDEAGIKVLFQQYQHGEYPQRFPKVGFTPRLSALDLFMNLGVGSNAKDFILSHSKWVDAVELEKSQVQQEHSDNKPTAHWHEGTD